MSLTHQDQWVYSDWGLWDVCYKIQKSDTEIKLNSNFKSVWTNDLCIENSKYKF